MQSFEVNAENPIPNTENIQITINPEEIKTNNTTSNPTPSNPFVDAFREMNNNSNANPLMDFMNNFGKGGQEDVENITSLYDVLGKLSDQKDSNLPEGERTKELYSLFENLLEFLLKSEMLAEPLSQIKQSVTTYLEKNSETLKKEDEEKYKSMLNYIDIISAEISKKEPNKPMIINIFYKLHELSDFDNDLLNNVNPGLKEFSDLFGSNLKK